MQMKVQSDEARARFQDIVKLMDQEMERFQEEKTRDLGAILQDFARAQAQLAADTADAWRTLLPELDKCTQEDMQTVKSSAWFEFSSK